MSKYTQFWTEERLQVVAHMWHEGKTEHEIALHFGKTIAAVQSARRNHGMIEQSKARASSAFHKLPNRPPSKPLPIVAREGWPTRAQLMAGR